MSEAPPQGCQAGETPTPSDPTVAPCLGTYGDPRGVGVSYERGTPVTSEEDGKGRVVGVDHAPVASFIRGTY